MAAAAANAPAGAVTVELVEVESVGRSVVRAFGVDDVELASLLVRLAVLLLLAEFVDRVEGADVDEADCSGDADDD